MVGLFSSKDIPELAKSFAVLASQKHHFDYASNERKVVAFFKRLLKSCNKMTTLEEFQRMYTRRITIRDEEDTDELADNCPLSDGQWIVIP